MAKQEKGTPAHSLLIVRLSAFFLFCTLLFSGVYFPAFANNERHPSQVVILQNKRVRAELEIGAGGLLKEKYYGLENGKWRLILSQFYPKYKNADTAKTQLWNTSINNYRFLVSELKVQNIKRQESRGNQKAIIQFSKGNNLFIQVVSLNKEDAYFHIEVRGTLEGQNPFLDYLLSAYTFHHKGVPDFVHTPGLKFDDPRSGKGRDQILGDRSFHSPAVILQQDALYAAMIPDLAITNKEPVLSFDARKDVLFQPSKVFYVPVPESYITMPTGIDLNVNSDLSTYPILTYGLMDSKVGFHTRFVREERNAKMVRKLRSNEVAYGFDLLLPTGNQNRQGYEIAARHIWRHYGAPTFASSSQLVMPFVDYLRQVQKTIFSPIRDKDGNLYEIPGGVIDPPIEGYEDYGPWLQWETANGLVGGFRCSAPFWTDVINNSVFWNQARETVGMHYWGTTLNDPKLLEKAKLLINFCLSAPRNENGLFATVFNGKDKTWGNGWSDPPNGQNKLFMRDAKSYEIPPLCKTGAHLLDYYQRAEKDRRIVDYLLPFANWLVSVIDDRGIIPSYVTQDMASSSILYESAQPAAGMWFLAEMYKVTREPKYLEGAEKIAHYIEKEIIPTAKWIDMEQYVSCGAKPFSMIKDQWQGQWFRGNLCIMWACEGFSSLHDVTGNQKWLRNGEKCIDYLSFTQASWSPHFVYTANPFGGFGADNSDDAAMLDQRQEEFSKAFLIYGLKLNRKDLLERGVAAGKSGCILINHRRHVDNKITPAPRFYPDGLGPENIDHEGVSQWPMRTHPLWGEGTAVFTGLSEIERALGGLYIDLRHDFVIPSNGIKIISNVMRNDGTRVINVESFLSKKYLQAPYENSFGIPVVIQRKKGQKIILNGKEIKENRIELMIAGR